MIKLLILTLVIFCLFIIENKQVHNGKESTQYGQVLYGFHVAIGIAVTVFATFHGLSHIQMFSTIGGIIGLITFLLLCVELITGFVLSKNKTTINGKLKFFHKVIPAIVIICIFLHILVNKAF